MPQAASAMLGTAVPNNLRFALELASRHLHNFCHFLEAFHANNAIDEITDSYPTTLRSSRELL
jgi:hypothetical protein